MARLNENGTDEGMSGLPLDQLGRTDGAKTQQVSVWLREDQLEALEQFQEEYDLSRSEAVRIAVDMMGAGPGILQTLAQQRAEMLTQLERLEEFKAEIIELVEETSEPET